MRDAGRDALDSVLNSRGRDLGHVALGAGLVLGTVALSALIATRNAPTENHPDIKRAYDRLVQPGFKPPRKAFQLVWPPLFAMLAWSGLRIWNARDGAVRTRALGLWGLVQGLNALWLVWGPERRLAQLLTGVTALGATAAYVNEARKVDGGAAAMVAPYAGWISFANLLTEEVWRRNRPDGVTLH